MTRRSVEKLLPEYLQTKPNKKFLSATISQLVSRGSLKKLNGYIGNNRFGASLSEFVVESTSDRNNYQLEPAVVTRVNGEQHVITYPELVDRIASLNGPVADHERLFDTETYSYNGYVDLDKLINFGQYYWLPQGANSVSVGSTNIPLDRDFLISEDNGEIHVAEHDGELPELTVARTGSYRFASNVPGTRLWLYTEPSESGRSVVNNNVSVADVLGTDVNGIPAGNIIQFNVPAATAQSYFNDMPHFSTVSYASTMPFNQIHNQRLDDIVARGGIDGQTVIDNKTIVFVHNTSAGWTRDERFDSSPYDTTDFAAAVPVTDTERMSVWRINIVNGAVFLTPEAVIPDGAKWTAMEGTEFTGVQFYRDGSTQQRTPYMSAELEILYYVVEDIATSSKQFGVIRVYDAEQLPEIRIEEILSSAAYTSPNGVAFTNGLKIRFANNTSDAAYAGREFFVEGVGTQIRLVPVDELATVEGWTTNLTQPFDIDPFDTSNFDSTFNSPVDKDYIVVNRSSVDRNPWSRHNRWFHVDVIQKTAEYNGYTPVIDNAARATRPIIEFKPDLKLFEYGHAFGGIVDVVCDIEHDALSNINGQVTATCDGITLSDGDSVLFIADTDEYVRSTIYRVDFVNVDTSGQRTINLTEVKRVAKNENYIVAKGLEYRGKTMLFTDPGWAIAQEKLGVNQKPLFDLIDTEHRSLAEYNDSTFAGSTLFEYKTGAGAVDTVIGERLSYRNFNNVGDIEFVSAHDTGTVSYTENSSTVQRSTREFFAAQIIDRLQVQPTNAWSTDRDYKQYQIKHFDVQQPTVEFAVPAVDFARSPAVLAYYNGVNVPVVGTFDNELEQTVVVTRDTYTSGTVTIKFMSSRRDADSYYEIPQHLENNANNAALTEFTLGQLRNHLGTIVEHTEQFAGQFPGAGNLRDLGNYTEQRADIRQSAASFALVAGFLGIQETSAIDAIKYAELEYFKFKNRFVDLVQTLDGLDFDNPSSVVDTVLTEMTQYKSEDFAFFASDMVPYGADRVSNTYTVVDPTDKEFRLTQPVPSNTTAALVYYNDKLLSKNSEYVFNAEFGLVELLIDIVPGDLVRVDEYRSTLNNYVPATPSKLGLWPAYTPAIVTDTTRSTPAEYIRGHDGSMTAVWGDATDAVALELERRIYNNIKTDYSNDLFDVFKIQPGAFRENRFSRREVNQVLAAEFNEWSGANNVNISDAVTHSANDPWSWTHSNMTSKRSGDALPGYWRGIYQYYYDTQTPHLTPWEMLGYTEEPAWWKDKYGPAPYTSGNAILWDDISAGRKWNPLQEDYAVDAHYARPDLRTMLPVNQYGELVPPVESIVAQYDSYNTSTTLLFGDGAPAEHAWRTSSNFPFAMQIAAILLQPARYLSLMYDTDAVTWHPELNQIVSTKTNNRLTPAELEVHSRTTYVNGFGQWLAEFLTWQGKSTQLIRDVLDNSTPQLVYKLAGYTDKQYVDFVATQVSPTSDNESVIIPKENYTIIPHKSQPLTTVTVSTVIIERTTTGFAVSGFDQRTPVFTVQRSKTSGATTTLESGGLRSLVYTDFYNDTVDVPYGTEFQTAGQVANFLYAYGKFLEQQGFVYDTVVNERVTANWSLSVREFLFWVGQRWTNGSIIAVNPAPNMLKFQRDMAVADSFLSTGTLLDIDNNPVDLTRIDIYREGNYLEIESVEPLALVRFDLVQHEHIVVFDNVTLFNDIIYDPAVGSRQYRLRTVGYKTLEWDGSTFAPGFVSSADNISEWQPGRDYKKGDVVVFKSKHYVAKDIIAASNDFNNREWKLIDKPTVGLLPNLDTKAEQLANYYDVDSANLDQSSAQLSNALIGFSQRSYFKNLLLDDASQVKFYQGMLREKGSPNSFNRLLRAKFDNLTTQVDVSEEWAVLVGAYGATDINQSVAWIADQSRATSNPADYTFDAAQANSDTLLVDSFIRKSNSNPQWLTQTASTVMHNHLPTAGPVRLDQVDFTLWSTADIQQLTPVVASLEDKDHIWVARHNHAWTVFRAVKQPIDIVRAETATTGHVVFIATADVPQQVAQYVAVQGLGVQIDGFYEILNPDDTWEYEIPWDSTSDVISKRQLAVTSKADNVFVELLTQLDVDNNLVDVADDPASVYFLEEVVVDTATELSQLPSDTAKAWTRNNEYFERVDNAWQLLHVSLPADQRVDVATINRAYLYDLKKNLLVSNLDYIDPAKGKNLGIVDEALDYIVPHDPANYNTEVAACVWSDNRLGTTWWDVSTVAFVDYETDNLHYNNQHWGAIFPGASVDVYEWVRSTVEPTVWEKQTSNTARDVNVYSTVPTYNSKTNSFDTVYYFWAKRSETAEGKTISTQEIANYIARPQSANIPFVTFTSPISMQLHNSYNLLDGANVAVNIDYDTVANKKKIHTEYQLIKEGSNETQLPAQLLRKLIDSLAGVNTLGQAVPDADLSMLDRYGIAFRPRQSMIADRSAALAEVVAEINSVLISAPFAYTVSDFSRLQSREPLPVTGFVHDVADRVEFGFIDTAPGDTVLIRSDETRNNRWTIINATTLEILDEQSYNTAEAWDYVDWYAPSYSSDTFVHHRVAARYEISTLNVADGERVRVDTVAGFEIYEQRGRNLELVAVGNGTIQLNSTLATLPATTASRQIIANVFAAMQQDFLVGNFARAFNGIIFTLFKFILREQPLVDWLFKTSFIVVDHNIRGLDQYPVYQKDNQTFLQEYINEVKPYRTKIREYTLRYDKREDWSGDVTDFDIHSYYDTNLGYYRKPNGEQPGDFDLLREGLNTPWNNNHMLHVAAIDIARTGRNYTIAPRIVISGDGEGATATARVLNGRISEVIVTNPGTGYTSTPVITLDGGNGEGALLVARMANDVVRQFAITMKFDRTRFASTVAEWQPHTAYSALPNNPTGALPAITITVNRESNSVSASAENAMFDTETGILTGTIDAPSGWAIMLNEAPPRGFVLDPQTFDAAGQLLPRTWSFSTRKDAYLDAAPFHELTIGTTVEFRVRYSVYTTVDEIVYRNTYNPQFADYLVHNGTVYTVSSDTTTGAAFDIAGLTRYTGTFDNAADRMAAWYQPTENMYSEFADNLTGITYNGVRVYGNKFEAEYTRDSDISSEFVDLALGTRPADINIDGSNFVDIWNSHAPEELVPGRVYDTLALTVYQRPTSNVDGLGNGLPFFVQEMADITAATRTRSIDITNNVADNVIVYHEDGTAVNPWEYTIEFTGTKRSIVFEPSLYNSGNVFVYVVGAAESQVLAHEQYISANTGAETYELNVPADFVGVVQVNINGTKGLVESTTPLGTTLLVEVVAPAGAIIDIWLLSDAEQTYNEFRKQIFTVVDASTLEYTLNAPVNTAGPAASTTVVEVDGKRLRPANVAYYTASINQTLFDLPNTGADTRENIVDTDVEVWVNGTRLRNLVDYAVTYDIDDLVTGVALNAAVQEDAKVAVGINTDAEYRVNDDLLIIDPAAGITAGSVINVITFSDSRNVLGQTGVVTELVPSELEFDSVGFGSTGFDEVVFNEVVSDNGEVISVTRVDNSRDLELQTVVYTGQVSMTIENEIGFDTSGFDSDFGLDELQIIELALPEYDMPRDITDPNFLWVTINGRKLHPYADFNVIDNKVVINSDIQVASADVIAITSFIEQTLQPAATWMQFKDMNDHVEYYRLTSDHATLLTQPLHIGDTEIHVADATVLSDPSTDNNVPGVIFVGNERITFWQRTTTVLSDIRRGTAGTGASMHYPAGTIVVDAGFENKVQTATIADGRAARTWQSDNQQIQRSTYPAAEFVCSKAGILYR